MAHLEMSVTEPTDDIIVVPPDSDTLVRTSVDRWADAADGANEACLIIDAQAVIAAVSPPACGLLGFADPTAATGQCLYEGVLPLVDFTAAATPIPGEEVGRIPPLQALSSRRLARGLIRVRIGGEVVTVDAVSTPLWEGESVIGSLTFFCQV